MRKKLSPTAAVGGTLARRVGHRSFLDRDLKDIRDTFARGEEGDSQACTASWLSVCRPGKE